MSLGVRVLTAIVLLGVVLAAKLSLDAVAAFRTVGHAEVMRQLNARSTPMLVAAGALAAERGLTNGALGDPTAVPETMRRRMESHRILARAERAKALDVLATLPFGAGNEVARALEAEKEAAARLDDLRRSIDAALNGSLGQPPSQAAWFTAATQEIDALTRLRRLIEAAGMEDPELSRLLEVRDALAEISEFAGQERGRLNGAIAAAAKLPSTHLLELGFLRGRVEGAWARIQARAAALPPSVAETTRLAGAAMFGAFQEIRGPVMRAAADQTAWPVAAQAWFAAASEAIDAVLAAQLTVSQTIDREVTQSHATARMRLAIASASALGAIVIVVGALWYVIARVIRPLKGAVQALVALTSDNLDVVVPEPRGNDEVAALLRATRRFQITARAHAQLEAAQVVIRQEADAGRAQAVREVGTLIEQESTQAVETVAHHADQLRELSDRADAGARAIGTASAAALGAANQSLSDSNVAAAGARELATSIGEIARQMNLAASTTQIAVDRSAATRNSFEALNTSVTEISDVAHLIADIASRTNLLALNATIEAARSGAAGKGFAVVAAEVKQLARQTAQSTERIGGQVNAIETAAREAHEALAGVVGAVEDLASIATQVAAAIEQQSAATASISEAVDSASRAAQFTAERLDAVAVASEQCGEAVGGMHSISRDVAERMTGLKQSLANLLRGRVAELDRRSETRYDVQIAASLEHTGGAVAGTLSDISAGGGCFVGAAAGVECGRLLVTGIPPIEIQSIAVTAAGLHFKFTTPSGAERQRFAQAIRDLGAARRAA